MANIKRSSIVGFHNIKNKVTRNAFDLSHRHMFTAQIGELLPIFVQWVNPNETFKLGYNGFSRTQPLQTAAFTRLKENVQYYFVPFQSLWKYFEQQVNNMTKGQSGENISKIAKSFSEDTSISTKMPYINYAALSSYMEHLLDDESAELFSYWSSNKNASYVDLCARLESVDLMPYGILRSASMAKLLRALGYGNTDMDTYDIVASFISYVAKVGNTSASLNGFRGDVEFGYAKSAETGYTGQPNLSIFPLLAYHKIIQDHYIYRQWQPYRSFLCNIDYITPSSNSNFATYIPSKGYKSDFFTLAQGNLPLDYFNGVLPKAQYGEESAVNIDVSGGSAGTYNIDGVTISTNPDNSQLYTEAFPGIEGNLSVSTDDRVKSGASDVSLLAPHVHNISGSVDISLDGASAGMKISALRSAIALQKYKEIQESNDSDFASQVLAHFGVKPKHEDYKSIFIGGGDSVIDINPQVNQNLVGENSAEIKATGAGQLSAGCKFTSDTYGIIIGIYRCVPQLDLAKVGIDRSLFKTDASDFPIPEFDRLGMQTQYRCELVAPRLCYKRSNPSFAPNASLDLSQTYGYLPRYAELKTSYDRYEGAFLNSLRSWVTGYDSKALQRWLLPKLPYSDPHSFKGIDDLLVCRPSITNNIFVDQSAACADNDKLLVGSVNTCVAIRPYSVYGLPYSK